MSKSVFPEKLYSISGFQRKYLDLVISSVKRQFNNIEQSSSNIDWNYMLLCASILAKSEEGKHLDAALRISQFCMVSNELDENQKVAAAVVLDSLTNSPAIQLALDREYLKNNYEKQIPLPLQLNRVNRLVEYSIFNHKKKHIKKSISFSGLFITMLIISIGLVFLLRLLQENLIFYYA
ncbi:hypothetical protein [Paenibacillus sp. E194]|uniref:hypothetical protein n=1 Tax=Paenibacillus sp. E194 TaxID=1458845 RepID=UPI000B28585E|nr:hypothetical protein [Paenibacillus sp. E194]